MSQYTLQQISLRVKSESNSAICVKETDIMAVDALEGPKEAQAQEPAPTADVQGELSRFVGVNRTAQDIWWLRKEFDNLTKKMKVYGPHFEDELEILERAIEMFGDKEPEKP